MSNSAQRGEAAVETWLWLVALLVLAMVVVGGATRLTESGLSMTITRRVGGGGTWRSAYAYVDRCQLRWSKSVPAEHGRVAPGT